MIFHEWYGEGGNVDEGTESSYAAAHRKTPRRFSLRDELRDTALTSEALKLGTQWLAWFDEKIHQKEEHNDIEMKKRAALIKEMHQLITASKGSSLVYFNRDLGRILFFLVLWLSIVAAGEYLGSKWPQGSFYFCQLPYLVAITSFKPFAVPMYYVLTVVAHHSFVEQTFQHSPDLHEPAGAIKYSPLPRDVLSRFGFWCVGVSFTLWFATMLVVCAAPFLYFAPIILVTGFVLPMAFMYLPATILDVAINWLRHWAQLPVSLKAGISFEETVLVLKGATTQVTSIGLLALPMVRVLRGEYSYDNAVRDVLQPVLDLYDFRTFVLHFKLVFAWPDFVLPRLGYYLGASVGLIFLNALLKLLRKVFGSFDYYSPLLGSPGKAERWAQSIFTWMTWRPFRSFSDLVRTACTATMEGRHDFKGVMYGGFPHVYLGSVLGNYVRRAPNFLLVALGPFLVAARQPFAKVFSDLAEDDDVVAFMNDEASMAYYKIICRSKKCGVDSLEAILKSAWLEGLDISFCENIHGNINVLQKKCRNLSELAFANCPNIKGTTSDLHNLVKLKNLIMSRCPGIAGDTQDLKGLTRMKNLRLDMNERICGHLSDFSSLKLLGQLVITGCKNIKGSTKDLVGLTQLKTLRMTGCMDIEGSIDDLSELVLLKDLWVGESIGGSLAGFSNLTRLKTLKMNRCNGISGHLNDLVVLTRLEVLDCTGTSVDGSPDDLRRLTNYLVRLKDPLHSKHGAGIRMLSEIGTELSMFTPVSDGEEIVSNCEKDEGYQFRLGNLREDGNECSGDVSLDDQEFVTELSTELHDIEAKFPSIKMTKIVKSTPGSMSDSLTPEFAGSSI